jgi:methionyl-tRNA synthetase
MNKYFYITTPIYYVNDAPHIGHAYTSVACDVIARFMRLDNYQVKFLTGTDEHGQKVEKSAKLAGISAQEFTDEVSKKFRNLTDILNLSNDDFIRTTEERHKIAVAHFWNKLKDNGHIYKGSYNGWYCIRDEAFYTEAQLIDGMAPTGAAVEWVEEPSYFFNLSKWQDKLLEFYEQNPDFIYPLSRKNEVVNFVKSGLNDLSISRSSFKWGIKVPNDEAHVIYVWLDALVNYISALGYPELDHDFKKFWPANIHMVGKDIVMFHAVYWPAFLMAADIMLPKKIVAHGWWTVDGKKISKSLKNTIDPIKLIEEFGLDQTRYFLMREVPFGNDGNYSRSSMINRINSELSNNIGNLVQRTLSMIVKNCNSIIPEHHHVDLGIELLKLSEDTVEKVRSHIKNQEFSLAIDAIICLSNEANLFIDRQAPWKLAKTNQAQMESVLYILVQAIYYIAILLLPFTPDAASKILDLLAVDESNRNLLSLETRIKSGKKILTPTAIFARFQDC